MHFNELPEVVLAKIFHLTCNDCSQMPLYRHHRLKTWRAKLALLSVCRIWRELALPYVHRTSFIRIIEGAGPKQGDDERVHYISDTEDEDAQDSSNDTEHPEQVARFVKTNLNLIYNLANRHWPRNIQIYTKLSYNSEYDLHGLIEQLRKHRTTLNNVRSIHINSERYPTNIWTSEPPIDHVEASSIGEEAVQLMPHIKCIKLSGCSNETIFEIFVQSLFKGYAHQLTGFECPESFLEKVDSFSDKLTCAYISGGFNSSPLVLPQIYAENLTVLGLNYIRRDFSWKSFQINDNSRVLHFANLKWLRLRANMSPNDNNDDGVVTTWLYSAHQFDYKVTAPRLETVILQACPFTLSFLTSIHGLIIPNVELELEGSHIYFTRFNIDVARDKFASYAINSQDGYESVDMHRYMNDLLNIYGLAANSRARVGFNDAPLEIEQIDWKYLSSIEIYCRFDYSKLRALVSRMPVLESMKIFVSDLQDIFKQIPEINNETATVEPLNCSLRSLFILNDIDSTESDYDKLLAYIKKLLGII